MIDRYTRPEMAAIWNRRAYFEYQRQVELAVVRAWAEFGKIPLEDCELIQRASFTLERIDEIEREADHETNAFVTALAESLGPESRWLHLGLTSSDVLDTAGALQLRAALDQIGARLRRVESAVARLALKHRRTAMIG
ncbi:MAG: adenylosuccinate lyase, partial [Chloroflexi bacterium]|nr:adenylosuccinate lyase [Chloroflexota bacterium]